MLITFWFFSFFGAVAAQGLPASDSALTQSSRSEAWFRSQENQLVELQNEMNTQSEQLAKKIKLLESQTEKATDAENRLSTAKRLRKNADRKRPSKDLKLPSGLKNCRAAFGPEPGVNFPFLYGCVFWRMHKKPMAWKICGDPQKDLYARNYACKAGAYMDCRLIGTRQKISNCHSKFYPATRKVIAELDAIENDLASNLSVLNQEISTTETELAALRAEIAKKKEQLDLTRAGIEMERTGKCKDVSIAKERLQRERGVCLRSATNDCINQGWGNHLQRCLLKSPCGTSIKNYTGRDGYYLKKNWLELSSERPACSDACKAGGVFQFGGGPCRM